MKNKINATSIIKLALLALLILWTFYILKPFIGVLAWSIILAVAIFPFYARITKEASSKRKKLISMIFAIVVAVVIIVPTYSIFSSVLDSTTNTAKQLKNNTLELVGPTEKVKDWPIIGERTYQLWDEISKDTKAFAIENKEFILEKGKGLLNSFTGIMGALLLFVISFIISVVFMFNSKGSYKTAVQFSKKMLGKEGEEIVLMSRNTVRSVVKGILLVAMIQAILSFIGFKLIGLPAAGIFTFLVLFSAIIQVPVTLAVIPAIIVAFSISDNTVFTVIFTVYIIIVSLLDNFLKPKLLAKGLQTPAILIFLGAIGGVILHGIIGLFVGTTVIALVHQFYVRWVSSIEEE
jgi:predicted PurR-regulated permease PerM